MSGGIEEPLHNHNWVVRVAAGAEHLDDAGLGIDFVELKALVVRVLEPLAGKCLGELPVFAGANASAENLTKYVYDRIEAELPTRLNLEFVEIMESKGCWTKYRR
jgi:6-pyruvoyl-tetrahydropterin synthase